MSRYKEPRKVKLVFAERGGMRFSKIGAYIEDEKIKARAGTTFLNRRVIKPEVLDGMLVEKRKARYDAGLQIADVVASSFYHAVDNISTGPCRPELAMSLSQNIAFEREGKQREHKKKWDYGVVIQPTPDYIVPIGEDQRAIFRHYGFMFNPNFW